MKNIDSFFKSYKREDSPKDESNTYSTSSHILKHGIHDPIVKLEDLFCKIRVRISYINFVILVIVITCRN